MKTEALRELLAKASPRPWGRSGDLIDDGGPEGNVLHQCLCEEDAALIVAAINALPALLDVVEAAAAFRACFKTVGDTPSGSLYLAKSGNEAEAAHVAFTRALSALESAP